MTELELFGEALKGLDMTFNGGELPFKEKLFPELGLYYRELFIPEGSMVVGKKHVAASLNILAFGKLILMNSVDGVKVFLEGPETFSSAPNSQKLVKALTDCVFINVFKVNEGESMEDVRNRITKESLCQWPG